MTATTTASPWALLDSLVSSYMCMDSCRPSILYPYHVGTLREMKRYNVGYLRYHHFWKCQKQRRNKSKCITCFWRMQINNKHLIILRCVVLVICNVFPATSPAYVFLTCVLCWVQQWFHTSSEKTFRLIHIDDGKSEINNKYPFRISIFILCIYNCNALLYLGHYKFMIV